MAWGSPRGDQLRCTGGDPKSRPRRNRTGDTGHRARRPEASQAWPVSSRTPVHCAFFQREAIALESEARTLEGFTQRFYLAGQRLGLCLLNASSYLGQGKRLCPRNLQRDSDHVIGKCTRPTTIVTAHERANASNTPRVVG